MSVFLLDTCVLSEFKKPKPDTGLVTWLAGVDEADAFISVITIGELRYGIALLPTSSKRRELERWLSSEVLRDFSGRIVPIDAEVADRWGSIRARARATGNTIPPVDGMLAATALERNLTIVTRNEAHFLSAGARLLNPWSDAP
ncbi:MAG TPA: type II toxin-antitoxin system VapC family toxin [Candidatus Dormibacteraeota bacterium]|nr:type II toxin-antitoxin system VapC family toxin [Candidatus Dormibacteraeota bacterium]